MKVLVVDGNSILNRAFFGIKLLTTKDGRFTNAIYGFMNIFLRLLDDTKPDAVAIAFDLKKPTFRHKMYDGYKAGRKGMPPELHQQLPVVKEILRSMGYAVLEQEGFEADDILGTIAGECGECDFCYLATGDRDSFQLIRDNVNVLLPHTKFGTTTTELYTTKRIMDEYGVTPLQMIDIKALQGDSSDNIPGVAGIGPKTAGELIQKFGSLDKIYENLEELDIKENLKAKLRDNKDSAYLSYTLGTIVTNVPGCELESFIPKEADNDKLRFILTDLEMFKILEKMNLSSKVSETENIRVEKFKLKEIENLFEIKEKIIKEKAIYFTADYSDSDSPRVYINLEKNVYELQGITLGYFDFLKEILEDENIAKITDNSKYLYKFALSSNIDLTNLKLDTSLAGYVLNPSANEYKPTRLCDEYHIPAVEIDSQDENALQAAVLRGLAPILEARIESNEQQELLYDIEMPLAQVLASMENTGVLVDRKGISEFSAKIKEEISSLEKEIYETAGEEFNINSPKQLGVILFEKLGIPAKKKTKSGYSTSADVLAGLQDDYPIVEKILYYRTLSKLHSTYCEGLLKAMAEDNRVHSNFIQTETRTGRISSTEPNIQNIPVRKEIGREMRKFFIASENCVLCDADYSQIELRVLSHIADDPVMIAAFNDGIDVHTVTASQVFDMPIEMVTPLMRSRAKAVNFGIVYGIGAFSLAKDIGVTRAQADQYIKGYLHHYAGVNKYMEEIVSKAKADGYVSTMWKRRRYLPELSSSNGMLRAFGERVARNMPIQGTAADIIKIAMIRVYKRLKAENMESKLILQVHDELIVEAPENEAEKAAAVLQEEMENACKLKVKLSADVHIGKSWYEAKG